MDRHSVAGQMRSAAVAVLKALTGEQRELAARPFADDAARRWLEYRPLPRPGACIADMGREARKASHRLLAAGLSEHAYAQAMVIIALEEVLDRRERWRNGRHSNDYWVAVFGDPAGDDPWSWRFEGHHLSVTMTVLGDEVSPAPVFLGANPARVTYHGQAVSRPLPLEEDLAREALTALSPAQRSVAVVADRAPGDILTGTRPRAGEQIEPLGIAASRLPGTPRAMLERMVGLYLGRLPDELAADEAARVFAGELCFAWQGPITPGARHYYRVQGDDLLIEYDNTSDDGNHQHTVLRRPRSDFGDDVLAAHLSQAHRLGP
ncbi:MAG TPA: DUF3500 domain-containing protein [Streptosporangiaceae bacterium]|jgi:hypothetical protein|nr:DUF3500 domain-containing protein [Streptosporangiaceae bacterium]